MSEPMSDAEKIRNKRLAKLGSSTQSQPKPATEATSNSPPPAADASASSNQAKSTQQLPSASSPSASNPFSQLNVQSPPPATKISITPARPAENTRKRSFPAADDQPLEEWQDKQLRSVFRLSLDSEEKQDRRGNKLSFLGDLRGELEEQGAPLRLDTGLLDQALIEAASSLPHKTTPLEYFIASWKRIGEVWRKWKIKPQDERKEVLEEARRVCMNYCIVAITYPDTFQRPEGENPLAQHLIIDQDNERGIDHDFLTEISSRMADDESAASAIVGAVEKLSKDMRAMSMNDNYKAYVLALRNLVRYPPIVEALVQSELFLPEGVEAARFEVDTLLGPFFQISPLQGPVANIFFASPRTKDRGAIANAQDALRMSLRAHQTELDDIVDKFIKRSKDTRARMLDWFARAVNLNHKRRALQVDQKTVSSDGFMLNVTSCLDNLCSPFIDATFSKLDRIDPDYLRRKPRVDISDETKINADQKTSDEFYQTSVEGESNFISEVFFLNVAAHHYGTEAIASSLKKIEKDLKWLEKNLATLENDRNKIAATRPAQLLMFDRALEKYRDQLDKGLSYKYAIQGVLLDKLNQARSMQFMRYVIVWMLNLVSSGRSYPKQALKLPLAEDQATVFKCLPEYFVDDVVSNFKFIVSTMPDILTSTQSEELVTLCITFLRSSEYIKNPYLKAGLITIMFTGTWPVYGRSRGVLTELLNSMKFSTEHLLHSLMKFYIEVENTGAHTQFYDKFNIRYEIFQIIKAIWANRVFRDKLEAEAKVNLDFFVRFVNLLLNDVTYVLDEALSSLYKIRDLEDFLDSKEGQTLEASAKQEKEESLSEAQGKAKSYMQLTNETIEMLNLFTEALPESFTAPEIVQRLADMLDYNLEAMVGPKSSQLSVKNPKEYSFDPRSLLTSIAGVYLNLRKQSRLVTAVARDGRSYRHELFESAERILRKFNLRAAQEIDALMEFAAAVQRAKQEDDQAEEDLGDIPDEFLDPLMATLMEDPVILPKSRVTVDRSTIRSHLLSDPNDPFNRSPLKIEDVIPDDERRAQIEAFKAEKKGQKQQQLGGGGGGGTATVGAGEDTKMDTS